MGAECGRRGRGSGTWGEGGGHGWGGAGHGARGCCSRSGRGGDRAGRPPNDAPLCLADGIHSVAALCTLRVTVITDDMLTNSITVRLENMSQEKFLSPLLARFVEGVATVLSTTKDAVFVFNIQNDTDVSSNILNVTFSALLPGGVRDKFFPSEDLQEQIYLNRTLLTAVSTQRVLPFDDNICLREPCENYMKCVSVLKFDSSAPFISSPTVLFRPIHPVNGLRCRCPPGFTGDYCETEIDLCYSSPCGAHGRCRSREGGYTCECQEDFTGTCHPSRVPGWHRRWGGPGSPLLHTRPPVHRSEGVRWFPLSTSLGGRVKGWTMGLGVGATC